MCTKGHVTSHVYKQVSKQVFRICQYNPLTNTKTSNILQINSNKCSKWLHLKVIFLFFKHKHVQPPSCLQLPLVYSKSFYCWWHIYFSSLAFSSTKKEIWSPRVERKCIIFINLCAMSWSEILPLHSDVIQKHMFSKEMNEWAVLLFRFADYFLFRGTCFISACHYNLFELEKYLTCKAAIR